jgi:hypothetical protein
MDEVMDSVAAEPEVQVEETPQQEAPQREESEYGPKSSREYSQWLKGGMNASDPNAQRFQRLAKDNHARMFALSQLEKGGIDGVREKYALLDSITHGELKGVEAVSAIQDTLREVSDLDDRIAGGDFGVIDSFDDSMKAGIMKMVPNFLSMLQQSNPEDYGKALLPHFVSALRDSPMVQSFNSLVDVLNEAPPSWLPRENLTQWHNDRLNRVLQHVSGIGEWLNAQDKQAKALQNGKPGVSPGQNGKQQPSEMEQIAQERQKLHYERNITPQTNTYAEKRFDELFRPYQSRLKLNDAQKTDFAAACVSQIVQKANANSVYRSQMDRFYAMKNPDPKQVMNLFKVEFDKHASNVVKGLVESRYGNFLNGQQKQQPAAKSVVSSKPVGPNVRVVGVKPQSSQINFKATPLEWMHAGKYRMNDGSIVQVRK